jgi:uncharacterized protein (DUF1015 family)
MVAIAPFRALRYNPDLVDDLSLVVAPPYDVISPAEQDRLYEASPHNIVRLILGRQFPDDSQTDNRYTRAKQTFDDWRARRVLVRDELPALYLYEHVFAYEGRSLRRLGFVALLQFDGSVPERVLLHEATFAQPKADRARLLDAVEANLSPIFCIYDDRGGQIHELLNHASQAQAPLAEVRKPDESVRTWAVTEPDLVRRIQQQADPMKVLIADGHHRFEVALSRRHRFGAVMSYFSWLEDPAVLMRPIHRVVRLPDAARAAWRSRLDELVRLTPAPSAEHLGRWLTGEEGQGRFGYYEQGRLYQARLHEEVLAKWLLYPSVPLGMASLDVSLLHNVALPQLMGDQSREAKFIHYTADLSQAIAMVDAQQGDCAWLLRAIPVAQVFALAAQGFSLPQKSTYFHPKLLSGLFINPLD